MSLQAAWNRGVAAIAAIKEMGKAGEARKEYETPDITIQKKYETPDITIPKDYETPEIEIYKEKQKYKKPSFSIAREQLKNSEIENPERIAGAAMRKGEAGRTNEEAAEMAQRHLSRSDTAKNSLAGVLDNLEKVRSGQTTKRKKNAQKYRKSEERRKELKKGEATDGRAETT